MYSIKISINKIKQKIFNTVVEKLISKFLKINLSFYKNDIKILFQILIQKFTIIYDL